MLLNLNGSTGIKNLLYGLLYALSKQKTKKDHTTNNRTLVLPKVVVCTYIVGFSSITKCTCNIVVVYVAVSWPQQHLVILLVNYEAIKSIGAKWGCKKRPQRQPQCWGSYIELSDGGGE